MKLLKTYLIICALCFSACQSGPVSPYPIGEFLIKICIVDAESQLLQCFDPSEGYSSENMTTNLTCFSPANAEYLFQSCKLRKDISRIPSCFFSMPAFICGEEMLPFESADEYICISNPTYLRLKNRCPASP